MEARGVNAEIILSFPMNVPFAFFIPYALWVLFDTDPRNTAVEPSSIGFANPGLLSLGDK